MDGVSFFGAGGFGTRSRLRAPSIQGAPICIATSHTGLKFFPRYDWFSSSKVAVLGMLQFSCTTSLHRVSIAVGSGFEGIEDSQNSMTRPIIQRTISRRDKIME